MSAKQLTVVSSFPNMGELHSAATVGVASYTKTLLQAMCALDPELQVDVFAEKIPDYPDYREGNLQVHRLWTRGDRKSLGQLIKRLRATQGGKILIQFEVNMFGDWLCTGMTVLRLWWAAKCGLKFDLMMHQVPGDLSVIEGKNWQSTLKNIGKSILYSLIKSASQRLFVFEQQLKENLADKKNQVTVVPHFVPTPAALDKATARAALGLEAERRYVLFFGYIAPYKGIKELLAMWPSNLSRTTLIIAGGLNPNHAQDPVAQAYYNETLELAARKHAVVTGFVPEEHMPYYFAACDAMIFPYRAFISSSGPLSFAFAYSQPVIMSEALAAYTKTSDFADALARNYLEINDLTYQDDAYDVVRILRGCEDKAQTLSQFSREMAERRSLTAIASQTLRELFPVV